MPESNLFERAQRWINSNYAAMSVVNASEQVNIANYVKYEFPGGSSEMQEVDIIIVTSDVLEALDSLTEPRFEATRLLNISRLRTKNFTQGVPSPSDRVVHDVEGLQKIFGVGGVFVHGGRPAYNYGPPPALFHSALAQLDYHLRHLDNDLDELTIDAQFLGDVNDFIVKSLDIHNSEEDRWKVLQVLVNKLAGSAGETQVTRFQGAKPDVMWYDPYLTMIQENNNEFGMGGDAFLKAVLSYAKVVGSNEFARARQPPTNHPAVRVGLMGHFIRSGASCTLAATSTTENHTPRSCLWVCTGTNMYCDWRRLSKLSNLPRWRYGTFIPNSRSWAAREQRQSSIPVAYRPRRSTAPEAVVQVQIVSDKR
ncbi:uncharacterized protein B0H18DRAFT_1214101 [Fomitopsis serialis]|uniref:uncharacterized protein n=1 Tax=Fomitopsis serialis TaxID=139415 RepID=UPI0020088CB0|nr:uncharacterized protein B0H18DRAFT_1214101 [Neoantrodia serialis]KAH9918651.1 hypothetical protein B0H18DRAFT_1214101 [Neoantrodia serialis]